MQQLVAESAEVRMFFNRPYTMGLRECCIYDCNMLYDMQDDVSHKSHNILPILHDMMNRVDRACFLLRQSMFSAKTVSQTTLQNSTQTTKKKISLGNAAP